MNTIPFNPNDPIHLKGFTKWVKKWAKVYEKEPTTQIAMSKKLFNKLKKVSKSILSPTP